MNLVGYIPTELGSMSDLVYLDLSFNQLTGTVPTELGNLTQLQQLYLYNNQLTGIIPLSVCHISNLLYVDFQQTHVTICAPGCYSQSANNWATGRCLPINHGDLVALNALYTSTNGSHWTWNGYTPWNFTAANKDPSLPCSQWQVIRCDNAGRVTQLFLTNMNLVGYIPTELGAMSNLQYLDLSFNKLTGIIPLSVCHIQILQDVNFQQNHITTICATGCYNQSANNWATRNCLPINHGDLVALNALYTSTNGASWSWNGATPWDFTAAYANPSIPCLLWLDHINCDSFSRVTSINLKSVNLAGYIPTELGALTNLHFLDLSSNKLTGRVPTTELGALVHLYYLDLSHNLFSGTVPNVNAPDFYCSQYSASYTSGAVQNTIRCSMVACDGYKLSISLCSINNTCSGDTYIRLFEGSVEVAKNDDMPPNTCSGNNLCSALTYTVPVAVGVAAACHSLVLYQGCFGSSSCGGKAHVTKVPFYDNSYLGCYHDKSIPNNWGSIVFRNDRTMKWLKQSSSIDDCYNIARLNGFHYFGVQFGGECYGAYNLTESHADTKCSTCNCCVCDMLCSSGEANCGGSFANSVYAINKTATTYDFIDQKTVYHLLLDTVNDIDSHALGWVKIFERFSGNIILNNGQNVTNDLFHKYGTGNVKYMISDSVYNYYKRLTSKSKFDLYSNVAAVWSSAHNTLHTDFEMYSSYSDLLSNSNKWLFCNYDLIGVGYPRDCGPTDIVTDRWSGFALDTTYPGAQPNAQIWIQVYHTPTSRPTVIPSTRIPSCHPTKAPSNCVIEFIKNKLHSDETNHCKSLSGGGFTLNICAYKKSSKEDDVFYSKSSESGGMTVYDGHGAGSDRFLQLDMRSICSMNRQPSFAQLTMTSTNTKYSFQVIGSNTKGAIGSSSVFISTSSSWNQYVSIPNYCKFNYLSIVSSARDSMLTGFQLNLCAPTTAPANAPVSKPVAKPESKPIVEPVPKPANAPVTPVTCENEFISGRIASDDTVHSKSLSSGSYHMTAYAFKTSTSSNDVLYQKSEKSSLVLYNEEHGSGNDKFIQFDMSSICSGSRPLNAEIMMVSSTRNAQYNLVGSNKLGKLGSTMLPVSRWNQYVNIPDYCKYNYIGIISSAKDASIAGFRLRGCAPTRAPVQSVPKPIVAPVSKPVDVPIPKPASVPTSKPASVPIRKPVAKPNSDGHEGQNHASNSNNLTYISNNANGLSSDPQSNTVENSIIIVAVILSLFSIAVILGAYWLPKRISNNSVMKPSDTFTQDVVYTSDISEFESINPAVAVADSERFRREKE